MPDLSDLQQKYVPTVLRAPALSAIPWLRHGFSTRHGGVSAVYARPTDLNLGLTPEDDPTAVRENRRRLVHAAAPGGVPWPLATVRQVHSIVLRTISAPLHSPEEADGLLTDTPSLLLGVLTADCVPILLVDICRHAVAAVHAGWRGSANNLALRAVRRMTAQFSSRPEDLLAVIGPSIGPCCYQVGEELHSHFSEELFQQDRLDLWQANRRQLLAAGVAPYNIETLAQCTACTRTPTGERLFFSHRAEQGRTGRMMSLIGIAPDDPLP